MSVVTAAATAASQIAGAISRAARATGASFEYLLATAQIESSLNPKAQAPSSSAKGLYQFIDQTWLATVKRDGPALGLGQYADAIVATPDGHYVVPDAKARAAIMKLRSDPTVSAMMAGAFTRNNAAELKSAIGRTPTEGELYIAHFLGPDGAKRLIDAAANHPGASAAALFPHAAAANRSIFYDARGHPRSAREVYGKLTGRFAAARAATMIPGLRGTIVAQGTIPQPAAAQPTVAQTMPTQTASLQAPPAQPVPSQTVSTQAARPHPVPDTAGVTAALAQAASSAPPRHDTRPLFESMFSDPGQGAQNRTVSALWTPASSAAPASGKPPPPLTLFGNAPANPRALFGGRS